MVVVAVVVAFVLQKLSILLPAFSQILPGTWPGEADLTELKLLAISRASPDNRATSQDTQPPRKPAFCSGPAGGHKHILFTPLKMLAARILHISEPTRKAEIYGLGDTGMSQ